MKLKSKELISIHIHLSCDPTNIILGYKSGEVSVHAHRKTYTRMTISIFTIIDASWKQSSLSINKRMDKQSVAYSYNGILQRKEPLFLIQVAAWINLTGILLHEKSPIRKGTQCMIPFNEAQKQAQLLNDT